MPERTTMKTPSTLVEGHRLDQPTFHALYEAMPPESRAELIDGVVYLPGPICIARGRASVSVIVWLGEYAENTPGVEVVVRATTILGWKSELEPDALLRIRPECGGRSYDEKGYLQGAPELVAEVSKATRYVDLGPKKADYERAGVLEYIVRAIDPDEVFWFGQEQGILVARRIDDDGLYRSAAFPGLWLDPIALVNGDRKRLRTIVEQGCGTPEHADFVARLARQRGGS
jgi:hypothetical protein